MITEELIIDVMDALHPDTFTEEERSAIKQALEDKL
jgi:hypothetical protein